MNCGDGRADRRLEYIVSSKGKWTMSARNGLIVAALAAVATLGACAPMTKTSGADALGGDQSELVVENNNWQDMALYVLKNGTRWRIGSVPSLGKGRFHLSNAMIGGNGEIQLVADPLGSSRRFVTERIVVLPGQHVSFRLENNLAISSYSVW